MIDTRRVPLTLIDASRRLRPVDADWAAVMAADIRAGVELPPILIRPATPDEVHEGCFYQLVVGGHRVEAHRLAGLADIRADIREMSPAEAQIAEVDENLKRHELTALDRAIFLLVRKQAHDSLHPETTRGGDRRSTKRQTLPFEGAVTFAREAADRLGLSERTIRADLELAGALSREAVATIRGTPIARNAAQLRRLAAQDATKQALIAIEIASGRATTVAAALAATGAAPTGEDDPQEDLFRRACSLYSRMGHGTRARFIAHIASLSGEGRS